MDTYVECMIKAKGSAAAKFFQVFLTVLAVVCVLGFVVGASLLILVAIAAGVGAYFLSLQANIEYEYLYVDRELTVDKIMAQSKRKRVAAYQLDRMEIVAPIKSYHLDAFKGRDNNKNLKVKDFSVGEELKPDMRYVMYYEGGEKMIFNPSPELVAAMKNVAPRKIFAD